ncbi:MAG: cytochrome C assembly family protein [Rhodospirillales bacterium]|jgi:ABC-type uncharacterized transport system permease subunit
MTKSLIFGLSSIIAILPLVLISRRREPCLDSTFWAAVAVSIAGPLAWVFVQMSDTWQTGLSAALWVTVVASTFLFGLISILSKAGWKLVAIFAPYMLLLAILAFIWQQDTGQNTMTVDFRSIALWVQIHIAFSVLTYALVTLSGVSALGAFIQENALKAKQPTSFSRLLPSLTECESLTVRLLVFAAAALSFGLMSGMAIQYSETGRFLVYDHKTILSVTSFFVIVGLLFAHFKSGIRGRLAARFVLLVYLLMTLGYPGVKFVTNVLLG